MKDVLRHAPPSVPYVDDARPGAFDLVFKLAIVASVALVVGIAVTFGQGRDLDGNPWLVSIAIVMGAIGAAYGLCALVFALRHRPVATLTPDLLPHCTVIVPAYNEGAMVRVALLSALESRYPKDRLEIIAIDDGSRDDTFEHIQAVADAHPGRIVAIRKAKNEGKRAALRDGFLRASGEVVVTVDSDSKLDPEALAAIVSPIATDRRVSAVAGKVLVLNRYESLLTRLMASRFFITFDFTRAAQSRFGTVLCCPGALAAYRRDAVLRVLPEWSRQSFLGSPCTIGEDRALTTWLLRDGGRSVYQSSAIVRTLVPTNLRGTAKMLLRWERGDIRENLILFPWLLANPRQDRLYALVEVTLGLVQFPIGALILVSMLGHFVEHPAHLFHLLAFVSVAALVQSLLCLRSERSTDFLYNVAYSLFAFVGLQWVYPWSLITVRDGRWMTR